MAKRRERRGFTATESAEVWDRWQRGEGLRLIGRVFGRTSSAIFAHLKPHGGIRPILRRPRKTLGYKTPAERFEACVAMTNEIDNPVRT